MNTLTEGQTEYYLSDLRHMNVHSRALFSRSDDNENCSSVMTVSLVTKVIMVGCRFMVARSQSYKTSATVLSCSLG